MHCDPTEVPGVVVVRTQKKMHVDLQQVANSFKFILAIVILKDISLIIIFRCYFSSVLIAIFFHELAWCVNSLMHVLMKLVLELTDFTRLIIL